jgi:hypothetical protein
LATGQSRQGHAETFASAGLWCSCCLPEYLGQSPSSEVVGGRVDPGDTWGGYSSCRDCRRDHHIRDSGYGSLNSRHLLCQCLQVAGGRHIGCLVSIREKRASGTEEFTSGWASRIAAKALAAEASSPTLDLGLLAPAAAVEVGLACVSQMSMLGALRFASYNFSSVFRPKLAGAITPRHSNSGTSLCIAQFL